MRPAKSRGNSQTVSHDVGQVLDGEDLLSRGIQSRQHVQALLPTGRLHNQALEAPQQSEKWRINKMRSIQKDIIGHWFRLR